MHSLQNVYVHSISLKMSEYKHFKWRKTHGVQQIKDQPKSYVACDDVKIGVESMIKHRRFSKGLRYRSAFASRVATTTSVIALRSPCL